MTGISTLPNSDLEVVEGNMSRWTRADHRRRGWHQLHRIARYSMSLRAARVMPLERRAQLSMADLDSVRNFTSLPWFSAMVVTRGPHVLFERYAPDFGPAQLHSVQSITKTTIHLIIGLLVEQGQLDLSKPIAHYLPDIGTGYAEASVQQVLNMDVVNDYTEDFTNRQASYFDHEEAMGWRLPKDCSREQTQRAFLARITSKDLLNRSGHAQYKDANTDVLGWLAEHVSGRPLRRFLADIVDAAGLEGAFHISTDRDGVPAVDGGASLTARDLARYFAVHLRGGLGVSGERVGSPAFLEQTLGSGVQMPTPFSWLRYSNHLMVNVRTIGHGGWGGQYVMANLDTGILAAFLSVIENEHAINREYLPPVIRMLEQLTSGLVGA